jgi:hypothetical protein
MRIAYDPLWSENAKKRINQAFNKAYQKAVSEQDIQKLNSMFAEFQICLNFVIECDSNIHKKRILPKLINDFEELTGYVIILT